MEAGHPVDPGGRGDDPEVLPVGPPDGLGVGGDVDDEDPCPHDVPGPAAEGLDRGEHPASASRAWS